MLKESPVFIVGCPKTGTTLVRTLLNNHEDFELDCELSPSYLFLKYHWEMLNSDLVKFDRSDALSRERTGVLYEGLLLRQLAIDYFTQLHSGWEKGKRWGNSTSTNAFHHRLIRSWFPKSTFVMMLRDPRDTWASIKHNTWPGQSWLTRIDGFCQLYMKFLDVFAVAPGDFVLVRYEDVVENPQSIYDRMGLAIPPDYAKGLGEVFNHRTLPPQPTEPSDDRIYDRRGRWRSDGLSAEEQTALQALLQRCTELGYSY